MIHERPASPISLLKSAIRVIGNDPVLLPAFKKFQKDAKKLTSPLVVDLTSTCNLFCEGCYYFEGDNQGMRDEEDIQKWEDMFRLQKDIGSKFVYIGGAEPALFPERIRLAAENIPYGTIAANGTVKIALDRKSVV